MKKTLIALFALAFAFAFGAAQAAKHEMPKGDAPKAAAPAKAEAKKDARRSEEEEGRRKRRRKRRRVRPATPAAPAKKDDKAKSSHPFFRCTQSAPRGALAPSLRLHENTRANVAHIVRCPNRLAICAASLGSSRLRRVSGQRTSLVPYSARPVHSHHTALSTNCRDFYPQMESFAPRRAPLHDFVYPACFISCARDKASVATLAARPRRDPVPAPAETESTSECRGYRRERPVADGLRY